MKIDVSVEYIKWECECCGSGYHTVISIPYLGITYSDDDQFGGKLNDDHNDWPYDHDMDVDTLEKELIKLGYEVNINVEYS